MRPRARRDGLVVRELPGELVVYDSVSHRAHCLNDTAARVFRSADGTRSVAALAALLDGGEPHDRAALVRSALETLAEAGLLDDAPPVAGSRRELLQKGAVAAGLLLPAVVSVLAPTPAEAATCLTSCVGSFPTEFDGFQCRCVANAATCGTCASGTCSGGGGCP